MALAGHTVARLRRGMRRYGARGAAVRAAEIARELVYMHQVYVWYELALREERPRRSLDPGFRVHRATGDDLVLLDELWEIDRAEARRRLAAEGTLWLVLDGDRPAFSCWTFRGRTPIRAAQGGWLPLPDGVVALEESMTAAAYRGRGVAPAAWSAIADDLAEQAGRMVTTIEEENAASRKAVEKIGFREIGRAVTTKRGPRLTVEVSGEAAPELLAPLRR